MKYRGYWLDSHSSHIEEELFRIASVIVDECPNLRAIIFEIMDQHVDEGSRDALRDDVRRLRSLWIGRRKSRFIGAQRPVELAPSDASHSTALQRREETLGALALGRVPRDPDPSVVRDSATVLYADLVASMREGVIYETLPFLVRLLLVSIGSQATMDLISAYRANVPPEPFGANEARRFISYVRMQELAVPYLPEILDLQDALITVDGTLQERTVTFDCDPETLFDALLKRRCPGKLARKRFYVDVSANGIQIRGEKIVDTREGCGLI